MSLDNETYMKQIKRMIKPAYYAEIQEAIQAEDEDLLQLLITKYLSKKQSQAYLPQVLFGLRKLNRKKKSEISEVAWSKHQILSYLKDKLQVHEYEQVWQYIENGDSDLCRTVLRDLLRYEQAQEILPHIQKLAAKNPLSKSNVSSLNESFYSLKKKGIASDKPIENPEFQQNYFTRINNYFNKTRENFQKCEESSQKKKKDLLDRIEKQIGEPEEFTRIKQFLANGRLKKAQNHMKQILGKKQTQKFMESLKMHYEQKINSVLENSILIRTTEDGLKIYQVQTQQKLQNIPESDITNVLIVGMTGVGKSTYLNSLVNYLLDVEMEDDFRYILTRDVFRNEKGKSSTTEVKIYGLPKQGKMKKNIRLIDIPGLGDTGGIQKDKENLRKIKDRIEKTVPYINLIVYVFKASDTRVTKEAEYVIGQIMGMFAKDMSANIIFVLTFADNDEPRVISQLKSSFSQVIQEIKSKNQKWYVKVNNSAMFKKIDLQNYMDVCFYTMGHKCLEETANLMQSIGSISTEKTVSVMSKRTQLQTQIKGFNQIISASLTKQESIKKMISDIAVCQSNITGLKNYKIKYQEQRITYVDTQNNVTSCLECKFPCHKNCAYGTSEEKHKCISMENGFCKVCPNKCEWRSHNNSHQIINRVFVEVEKTNQDLYKKYQIESEKNNKNEELLLSLITQYSTIIVNITDYCQRLKLLTFELSLLELRKVNYATVVEYIEILIESEKAEKKQGYLERIRQYEKLKKEQIRMDKILTDNESSQLDKFQEIIKDRVKSLISDENLAAKLLKTILENYQKIKTYKKDMEMARKIMESQSPK